MRLFQVMKNVGAILEAAGSSWDKAVKTTILMARIEDYAAINDIYGEIYFTDIYFTGHGHFIFCAEHICRTTRAPMIPLVRLS